jgi:serine/threonine protein kinase
MAEDGSLGVIKLLSGHRFKIDKALQKRHLLELKTLQRVEHPNVLAVLDVVDLGGEEHPVLQQATVSLHDELSGSGRAQTAMAIIWLREAAAGLGAIHSLGFVHRDITPKNLLRMADGRICVGDLGTIRSIDEVTLTRRGERMGSLLYISPQQLSDPHAATPADDVFSLGQVAYFLLAGRRPQGNPPLLSQARDDLPWEVTTAVERMRSEHRPNRPRDGEAAAAALDLSLDAWMNLSVRLAQNRDFDDALQAMHAAFNFTKPEGIYQGDTPLQWLYARVASEYDPALDLRLARWIAECFPGFTGDRALFEAKRNWQSRMGEMPALRMTLPSEQGSLRRIMEQHWHTVRGSIEAIHRISSRRRRSPGQSTSSLSLGLDKFGEKTMREALVVTEAMLVLQWSSRLRQNLSELVDLLPSRWCRDFDSLDEALVVNSTEAANGPSEFLELLRKDGEGDRLWRRWTSSIDRLCTCEGVPGGAEPERPYVERADCPFILFLAAAEPLVDSEVWGDLWRENPRLQSIRYFADAVSVTLD